MGPCPNLETVSAFASGDSLIVEWGNAFEAVLFFIKLFFCSEEIDLRSVTIWKTDNELFESVIKQLYWNFGISESNLNLKRLNLKFWTWRWNLHIFNYRDILFMTVECCKRSIFFAKLCKKNNKKLLNFKVTIIFWPNFCCNILA